MRRYPAVLNWSRLLRAGEDGCLHLPRCLVLVHPSAACQKGDVRPCNQRLCEKRGANYTTSQWSSIKPGHDPHTADCRCGYPAFISGVGEALALEPYGELSCCRFESNKGGTNGAPTTEQNIAMLNDDLKGEHAAIIQYLRHAYQWERVSRQARSKPSPARKVPLRRLCRPDCRTGREATIASR